MTHAGSFGNADWICDGAVPGAVVLSQTFGSSDVPHSFFDRNRQNSGIDVSFMNLL